MSARIPVAYETLPTGAGYEAVRADVDRQLPLRNLHWVRQSSANRTIRTIQALPLDFRPLDSFGSAPSKPDLLARPYLYLLFVVCDDNETYRATVRTQIREWLDSVTAKQHQEWLIVHVTSGRGGVAKFYQRKGAIVDKIKADFNVGKKDRCIQVVQGASADDPTAWADFLSKVKEGIVATFDTNVALYEENVRKADSQRQLQGWQFLPFFRQKEALAESFEAMTLFEDALIQYDELEASFFQTLKEHNNADWYRNLGGSVAGDDSFPILSTTAKPYRKLIETNAISVFDFRIYLFARQANMLFRLGRVVEVARRGAYFVSTFARTLREHQASLGANFVESWTYSACLSIVEECERRISTDLEHSSGTGFVAVKAELLELAKKQLDKIGMSAGHLPTTHPFAMSLNEISPSTASTASAAAPSSRPSVSRQDLLDAIAEQGAFDQLYVGLTRRAIQAYQASTRKRCALKLHASLAALEHHRQRPSVAQKLYSQLPAHYTDARWSLIESHLLNRCAQVQGELDLPKDRLLSTLALIRTGMTSQPPRWGLEAVADEGTGSGDGKARMAALAKKLMDDVYTLSATLSKDEDGVNATVLIKNFLPCTLRVDEVRLKLSTADGEQVWLTAGACELQEGETAVSVQCPTSITGLLLLELSQLRFSRIIFQYSHRPDPNKAAASPFSLPAKQPFLLLPRDYQAVHIFTEEPDTVHLDREREVILGIEAGRNSVTRIVLRFAVSTPEVQLGALRTQLVEGAQARLTVEQDGAVVIEDIKPYGVVKLQIPLEGALVDPVVQVSSFAVSAEYSTTKRPHIRRHLRPSFAYSVALPLAVNVQDYFREHCLLSKFSVTTDGVQGLKIRSARIEAPPSVTVKPCRGDSHDPVLVSPLQTANFLFKLFTDTPDEVDQPLRLKLTYSSIEDRLRSHASSLVGSAFAAASLLPHRRWITEDFVNDALSSSPLDAYSSTESLEHLRFDEAVWRAKAQQNLVRADDQSGLLDEIRKLYQILSLVRIEPAIAQAEVGQQVQATLFIRSSFRWRRGATTEGPVRLAYTVTPNAGEWIVSGKAKGEYVAQNDTELSIPLTFVPLRPAALFLPSVAIQPLSNELISCETQHVTAATCVEVLPITHRTTFEVPSVPLAVR
ncbi:hypothetical protein JCM10213v2_006192 [Rhodosporidiobolus nylandii]